MAYWLPDLTCLILLSLLLNGATASSKETSDTSPKKRLFQTNCNDNNDCRMPGERCHTILHVCFKELPIVPDSKENKNNCLSSSDCGKGRVCHSLLKYCVKERNINQQQTQTTKQRKVRKCASSSDCKENQFCHDFFKICVDRLQFFAMAYRSSPKTHPSSCTNDTECPHDKYCHETDRMCLDKISPSTTQVTSPPACTDSSECAPDEYCHRSHYLCLKPPTPEPITGFTESPNNHVTVCKDDADCKGTETCYEFLPSSRRRLARVACHELSSSSLGCTRQRRFMGICIDTKLLSLVKKQAGNCSNGTVCGTNMCCIKSTGLCLNFRRNLETCVVDDVWFTCPCAKGLTCVSKGKKSNARRLAEKLNLPSDIAKTLTNKDNKRKRYDVGKCQKITK